MSSERTGRKYRINGLVQGVGFRPFVWRLAQELSLSGSVLNDGAGVEVAAWGALDDLDAFTRRLGADAPPLARVDHIAYSSIPGEAPDGFEIAESAQTSVATGIVPDAATCPDCLNDILDPANRRHGYAFTNCTHCGPRLSIISAIPYDRAQTSMRSFAMCPECGREYTDPADRRFHAQPNACPICGPKVWLEDAHGARWNGSEALKGAAQRLKAGEIGAIKGIGGFHLACDARNEHSVAELRRRKHRPAKPLALMVRDVAMARRFAKVSMAEAELLESSAAPIVLLEMSGSALAPGIAPDQIRNGVMLAYSPLHHLLMAEIDGPIVLTSGNLSEEPQATDNEEARRRLSGIADFFVMHDRDIVNRLDDSVARTDGPAIQILRRGRGLAPASLRLGDGFSDFPRILAMGGGLKSAFCLLTKGEAILSQHIGDLENAATYADYRAALALYRDIYEFEPEIIAVDQHPDYLSTRWGAALAEETSARFVRVQHHHAHLAACMADNGISSEQEMIGVVLDGLGLGTDGTIWGGEILVGGYRGFSRAAHFAPVPQPGGDAAQREPWRNLVAHLRAAFGNDWRTRFPEGSVAEALDQKPLELIETMMARGVNAPLSSSAGRLFDAVAAALGICFDHQSFEGQAAMALEALATPHIATSGLYPVDIVSQSGTFRLDWAPLWSSLVADISSRTGSGIAAARFHNGLVDALVRVSRLIADERGIRDVALTGGVMQNRILFETLHTRLTNAGLKVLVHRNAPANDGGLALGQAAIAALA